MKTHPKIPKLRFPEFRKNGEWPSVMLKQIAKRITEKNTDKSICNVLTNSAEHGIVSQRDYFDKDIATKSNLDRYGIVELGDFVYNPRISNLAPVGPLSRNDLEQGVMSPIYTVFRFNHADTSFYAHYFKSSSWHSYIRSKSNHGARHDRINITNADFMQMPIPRPTTAEQTKVADCFSSLDNLIQAEEKKLEALQTHKKGLMQNLFPRPSETTPRLRFPQFQNSGEWVTKPFAALYGYAPNNTFPRNQLNYEEGSVKNIHYGDIHTRFATHFRVTTEEVPYVNEGVFPDNLDECVFCRPGDVVFADASEDLAGAGNCIEIIDVNNEYILAGSHTILARPKTTSIALGFAGYLFKSQTFRAGIEKEVQGVKVLQISPRRLNKVNVIFPSSHSEQQQIASLLTTLDDQITAQTHRIQTLTHHKKGLLQQLFP